jgi:chemotaxis protein MotB
MSEWQRRQEAARAVAAGGNFAEWSVPWSDLMMIMFMVFAVLFIYSTRTGDAQRSQPPAERVAATKAPVDPGKAFMGELTAPVRDEKDFKASAGTPVRETYYQSDNLGIQVVRETDRQVRVFLRGDLFFGPGGDNLSGNSAPYLARIGEILRVSAGAVLVVGHTAAGEAKTPEESLGLSARRAAAVAEYFIRTEKLDPKRFLVTGRGSFQPEVPDTAKGADKRNRRVEVLVLTDI